MNKRQSQRHFEVKSGAETEFAILPGENPLEFERLHARVAEEWVPDGPAEENIVFTIAKYGWHKLRIQRFFAAKVAAAKFDPKHQAYDAEVVLRAFYQVLCHDLAEDEVEPWLRRLGRGPANHLRNRCRRQSFETAEAWIEALRMETISMYRQASRFGSPPDEVLMNQSAAVLTDEVLARQLEFEARIDAELTRAVDRLVKIKAAKRQITFREVQRFNRTHPVRLSGYVRQVNREDPPDDN